MRMANWGLFVRGVRVLNIVSLLKSKLRGYCRRMQETDWDGIEQMLKYFGSDISAADDEELGPLESRRSFFYQPPPCREVN